MPAIDIIDQISLGGFRDRANEDRLGASGSHAWVIDGATGLGEPFMGGSSDAAWLAQAANEAFTALAVNGEPAGVIAAAARMLAARFEAERTRPLGEAWELPCGAFLMLSVDAEGLTIAWNGDCRALIAPEAGPIMAFGATPLSEEAEAALVEQLVKDGGDPAQRYKQPEALAALRHGRGLALAPGRAQILCPDPSFVSELRSARVAGRAFEALLMTDGFAAAELRYGLYGSPSAMLAATRSEGLSAIARSLRRFESETDPDGRLKPRWKRSDDATALWLKITL